MLITKTVGVTGTFNCDVYRKYIITKNIDEDVLKEDYDNDVDKYLGECPEEFEDEAESKFKDEFDKGEITDTELKENLDIDAIDCEID